MAKTKIEKIDLVNEVKKDPYQEMIEKHQKAVDEGPKQEPVNPLKLEASELQQKLRKNQFYTKVEIFEVSRELKKYFDDNNLDTYRQKLIVK